MYLTTFTLPVDREDDLILDRMEQNGGTDPYKAYIDNPYPCGLFTNKGLSPIFFRNITVFYGSNGSGKSTLLNLIAKKLELGRIAPYNTGELFDDYANACEYETGYDGAGVSCRIPYGSRIITSDDVFDYMLASRTSNEAVAKGTEDARAEWYNLRVNRVDLSTDNIIEDYDRIRAVRIAKTKSVSRRQFIRRTVGEQIRLGSNGETAFRYFEKGLKKDTLYCLDEPENSLSPKMQLELAGACIYDLDADPVDVKPWCERVIIGTTQEISI